MATQLVPFHKPWREVDFTWIDFETTGLDSRARAVQVGIARFSRGRLVDSIGSLVNPQGVAITAEAGAVHGITDAMVADAPTLADFFARADVIALLTDAQPAAYNAPFDRRFAPIDIAQPDWPWADGLSVVRVVDKWARGKGRHKLEAACQRHGITLEKAHDASSDCVAAGLLFAKLAPQVFGTTISIGELLTRQRHAEADQWRDFQSWLANQPPQENGAST